MENLLIQWLHIFNWIDWAFFIFILAVVLTNDGFARGFLKLSGLVFSFVAASRIYEDITPHIRSFLSISPGLSKALAFFIVWIIAEILFFSLLGMLVFRLPKIPKNINKILGAIPAAIYGLVLTTLTFSLVVALPVSGVIKRDILDSYTGPPLLSISHVVESRLRVVFNDAIVETLNFLTIKPASHDSVDLGFSLKEDELQLDPVSEIAMFNAINRERRKMGLLELKFDEGRRQSARTYALEMITNGFFSHTSLVDGSGPNERLARDNINFTIAGENLAFAPDVQIAHTGLMNSEGHRANILAQEFNRVGVGVIDGKTFGKIFVQEFTD